MLAVLSLIVVLILSMLIVRIGSVALTLTGLSEDSARFQALSAFTGAGFTTSEAEQVVTHPARRRIIALLLRLGSAGIVSAIVSLFLSFSGIKGQAEGFTRAGVLVGSLIVLYLVARSKWFDDHISRIIRYFLERKWKDLVIRDYAGLLHLSEGYTITEIDLSEADWGTGKSLKDLKLSEEGLNVLGIHRDDGTYIATPRGSTKIHEGDTLIIYGSRDCLSEFRSRVEGSEGDRRHEEAVKEHEEQMRRQDIEDAESERRREEKKSGGKSE